MTSLSALRALISPPPQVTDRRVVDSPSCPHDERSGTQSHSPTPIELMRGYIALTKPRIIWLLLTTTVPAMVMAEGGWPSTWLVVATLVGGILTAGGASAINQFADREIDSRMERTRRRPLPSGIVSARHAIVFGVILATSGTVWLAVTVNVIASMLAAGAVAFYAVIYTYYLKPATVQNIVIGGAAGSVPPLIGWAAVTGYVGVEALLLFLIVVIWTPPHFWALALTLVDDYRSAGVPMLPVVRGEEETERQILRYSWPMVAVTLLFGVTAGLSFLYFFVAVASGTVFIVLAILLRKRGGEHMANLLFRYSTIYLALVFISMCADRLLIA